MELKELSNCIFQGVYSKYNEQGVLNRRRREIITLFSDNVFRDEYYVQSF